MAGIAIAAGFALFHGYAHGLEMPQAASPALYALGFVLRTEGELSLRLELRRPDGSAGPTTDVVLDTAGTYAGVVEFEARPDVVSTAVVEV